MGVYGTFPLDMACDKPLYLVKMVVPTAVDFLPIRRGVTVFALFQTADGGKAGPSSVPALFFWHLRTA
jgi:hypothetical protein